MSQVKRSFWPLGEDSCEDVKKNLLEKLSKSNKNSLVAKMYNAEQEETKPAKVTSVPPSIMFLDDVITVMGKKFQGDLKDKVEYIFQHLPRPSSAAIMQIEKLTVGQSENPEWLRARRGRITASNFGVVSKRMETLRNPQSNRSKDPVPLVSTLMGYNPPNPSLAPLKYGREMEGKALLRYVSHQCEFGHVNITTKRVGLVISNAHVFLGASPDSFVSCDCCGDGIVEVKCPQSVSSKPTVHSAECLTTDEMGNVHLKRSHNYYAQVQGQLGVCNKPYCDFVVYSEFDIFVERILFDSNYWLQMKDMLVEFYVKYLLPECLTYVNRPDTIVQNVRRKYKHSTYLETKQSSDMADKAIHDVACNAIVGPAVSDVEFTGACFDEFVTVLKENIISCSVEDVSSSENVDPCIQCPKCKTPCEEDVKPFCWQSIFCEHCKCWFHMKCAKMTKIKIRLLKGKDFICNQCKATLNIRA